MGGRPRVGNALSAPLGAITHSAQSASLMIALVMLVLVPATASAATARRLPQTERSRAD
jgi:hypothetical protein